MPLFWKKMRNEKKQPEITKSATPSIDEKQKKVDAVIVDSAVIADDSRIIIDEVISSEEQSIDSRALITSDPSDNIDWGNSPDIQLFFGREDELRQLNKWITEDKCNIVSIIGMSGIGKSALTIRLCKGIDGDINGHIEPSDYCVNDQFDYIIWRNLFNAPSLAELLADIIQLVSDYKDSVSTNNTEKLINRLLQYLKAKKCLIIFDNVESILQSGASISGVYREGYEDFEYFFKSIGEVEHDSCLLMNGREKPKGISIMETENGRVRSLELRALSNKACRSIFESIGEFTGTDSEWEALSNKYNGNPLAFNLLARHISEVYFGSIGDFLNSGEKPFSELSELVKWHVDRLTDYQREILFWIAIYREPVSSVDIKDSILDPQLQTEVPAVIQSLKQRLPVESISKRFFLQPFIIEYITNLLIDGICDDVFNGSFNYLRNYALIRASSKDSIRELQREIVIKQINERLIHRFGNTSRYEYVLKEILENARNSFNTTDSYVAGNIFNLLCQFKSEITDYNFSNLAIFEAYLQYVSLHNVDFSSSVIKNCSFRQTFGPISSVAISADGEYVAANESMGKIHIWRTSDCQVAHDLTGHASWIFGLTFSPDGKFLASGGEDKTIRLWNLEDESSTILGKHRNSVWGLAFSPDGRYLASGGEDKCIMVFDTETRQCIKIFEAHDQKVFSVHFSPDNSKLVSASADGTIKIWDVTDDFKLIRSTVGHNETVRCAAFNSDGKIITSCGWDHVVKMWYSDRLEEIDDKYFVYDENIHYVSYHPTRPIIASSSESGCIHIWNYETGKIEKTINKHSGEVWKVEFSADGRYLVSGGYDGNLIIWDVTDWSCRNLLRGYIDWIQDISISPDDSTIVCTNGDLTINVWDIASEKRIKRFSGHSGWTFSVDYTSDGHYLASGSDDLSIKLWNPQKWDAEPPIVLSEHKKWIQKIVFDKTGKYLASGDDDCVLLVWNIAEKRVEHRLLGHKEGIWAIAFSPDGNMIASAGEDGSILLWDWRNERIVKEYKGHADRIHGVVFTNNGKHLISCSEDRQVLLWDIATAESQELYSHDSWVMDLCISSDNRFVVSGGKDGKLTTYNLLTGATYSWEAHNSGIWAVAITHDNNYIVSAGEDGCTKIWNVTSFGLVKNLRQQKPYEGLNISNIQGLTEAQLLSLIELGADNNE